MMKPASPAVIRDNWLFRAAAYGKNDSLEIKGTPD
jgi:hypothetical protein